MSYIQPKSETRRPRFLPTGSKHDADQVLNYEPTVSPIATGGYAWVVFRSRRLYGNVATAAPWDSDPRTYDHTKVITPKKLWVAAVNLNVPSAGGAPMLGDDPSHPAFYLPAQELYAGNSRGFSVQDPCKPDGLSCEIGVECCSGGLPGGPGDGTANVWLEDTGMCRGVEALSNSGGLLRHATSVH